MWINQEILWLDISMNDVHLMAVINGLEQLENISLHDLSLQTSSSLLKNLKKRLVDEFEYQI